jgi:Alw26I/Eco31I/Esp3I family type II restriction m6 adenine DNA methyltransferase
MGFTLLVLNKRGGRKMNLECFTNQNLFDAVNNLFAQLGIKLNTNTKDALDVKNVLKDKYKDRRPYTDIENLYFAGLIDDSALGSAEANGYQYETAIETANKNYNGLMLFAVELNKAPNRSEIAELTRAFNRLSQAMPVGLVIKYGNKISIALSERFKYLQEWRSGEKIGKVIILRDINTEKVHEGHRRILKKLADHKAKSFDELHKAWQEVLNIKTLNATFYKKLIEWYELCFNNIQINLTAASKILNKKIDDELKPQAVIRVIIRLMFIWFMREKGLIKNSFFKREFAKEFLKNENTYYNAVLQNLFFAVLNREIGERRFRKQDKNNRYDPQRNDYGILDVLRFEKLFNTGKAEEFKKLTEVIPFINGGLFTCHDYIFAGKDAVTNEKNSAKNYFIDGFSERKYRAIITDEVIFKLIDLFDDFVFTIEESTPMEQDIALDPELLGSVFEELIAFYNPETKENARKQTGSFYTPREIVDYMCTESLKESLKTKLPDLHRQIDQLIDNNEDYLDFPEKTRLLAAITNLKVLDPACGSGAFPMGMFNLMVRTIEKLQDHKTTYKNKLDIITNCIYGVDIQNIAVEISKLRFFISLLVDCPLPQDIKNFDVLPNLETKFIVANALIGIKEAERKQQQCNVFDLEKEFEELSKIFQPFMTAKTPSEKENIKNKFNHKKEEIVNDVNFEFDTSTKENIRNWNPFNVCYCSPFFDNRIMFGINDGFDIVIGNPPYFVYKKEHLKALEKIKSQNYYSITGSGKLNAYRAFIAKSLKSIVKMNGHFCMIFQNSFCGDSFVSGLRKYIFENHSIIKIDSFPERDNISKRVFPGVKMSVCILSCRAGKNTDSFVFNMYSDREFRCEYVNKIKMSDIKLLDAKHYSIPLIKPNELDILLKVYRCHNKMEIRAIEGEINMTFHKHLLSEDINYAEVLKGAAIQRYRVSKQLSQGKREYLNVKRYEDENKGAKAEHHKLNRLAMQGITGVDDKRRLIFALVSPNFYLANSCNYILADSFSELEYLLGLMNSNLLNWIFKKNSTNSNVNCYEINNLPVLKISEAEQQPIILLVKYISLLHNAGEDNRANEYVSNSHIIQYFEEVLDALVYELYFENDFKNAGILFMQYAKRDFKDIKKGSESETMALIHSVYQKLRENDNEIRNNLKLMDIKLADLIMPIKGAK